MRFENKTEQFNYIMSGVVRAERCDLSSYLKLDNKNNNTENNTHITTDKSSSQMRE